MSAISVLNKEIKSELRTRYAISALVMFVFTSVVLIYFTTKGVEISIVAHSAIYWVIVFFASMTGLARTFVQEEERGTSLFLQLTSIPRSIFAGKLIYNVLLANLINFFAFALCNLFISGFEIKSFWEMCLNILVSGTGVAAAATVLSAIISKANSKNSLLPVLAFPVVIPILILAVDNTQMCFQGKDIWALQENLQVIISFSGILTTVSYLLFDFIWKE